MRLSGLRAVRDLGYEVRIQVPVPDPTERRPLALPAADGDRADAVQRHVLEDVLPAEQSQLTTGEDLRTVLEANRQVDLTHVDLRARLNATGSSGATELVVHTAVLDLRREAEVDCELETGFCASGFERCEGG